VSTAPGLHIEYSLLFRWFQYTAFLALGSRDSMNLIWIKERILSTFSLVLHCNSSPREGLARDLAYLLSHAGLPLTNSRFALIRLVMEGVCSIVSNLAN
jgi:hypothetical protein